MITLRLPWPPSVNQLRRPGLVAGHWRLINTKVAQIYYACARQALRTWGGKPYATPVHIIYEFHPPDKRKRDIFNLEKILSDSLVKAKVLADDRLIHHGEVVLASNAKPGFVIVYIEPLNKETK